MTTSNKKIVVAAFYKFVSLNDNNCERLKQEIKKIMLSNEIRGTVLLAEEGINSTVSGSREGIDNLLNTLRSDSRFQDLQHKESYFDHQVFQRSKVKIKKELIPLGAKVDPSKKVGKYVRPSEWNELISNPQVLVIDTRNDYEVQIGSFKKAINPHTRKFNELPKVTDEYIRNLKPTKIAMYCTGGIRCEKYSSYMLEQGFEEVYHLEGGILKYLEEIPQEKSLWEGECFVFDERVSVNHNTFNPSVANK